MINLFLMRKKLSYDTYSDSILKLLILKNLNTSRNDRLFHLAGRPATLTRLIQYRDPFPSGKL